MRKYFVFFGGGREGGGEKILQILLLTSSENKILTLLFRGNGEVVTKEKILQELWQTDEFIDANTLNVKMTRLRKKLGEIGFDKHIMTKRGSGYALV